LKEDVDALTSLMSMFPPLATGFPTCIKVIAAVHVPSVDAVPVVQLDPLEE
jgi:hypothetical protein